MDGGRERETLATCGPWSEQDPGARSRTPSAPAIFPLISGRGGLPSQSLPDIPIHQQASAILPEDRREGGLPDLCTQNRRRQPGRRLHGPCPAEAGTVHFCLESRVPASHKAEGTCAKWGPLGQRMRGRGGEAWPAHGPFPASTAPHRPLNFLFI